MSFSLRPTLRPVDWSQVDSHGKNIREHAHSQSLFYPPDSPDSDMEVDHDRWPSASTSARASPAGVRSAPPYLSSHAATSRPSTIGSRPPHASTSSLGYPQHKRAMSFEVPIQYYPPALSPSEMMWRDRFGYLFQKGYQLRPRYSPSWNPMGRGNSRHYHSGEDHIMQILSQVLDGIRRKDGLVVCVKMIAEQKKLKQIAIVQHFSRKDRLASDSRNHVVPFYDSFADAFYKDIEFMVTPVLRRFDDPPFSIACEVVDFVTQMLEGLVFMHENNVAHHNIIPDHIMMDAKSLIPTGWHFVSHSTEPDGMTRIKPLDRKNHPVRYYYIGFGKCYHIQPRPPDSTSSSGSGASANASDKAKGKMPAHAPVQAQGKVQGDGKSLLIMDIGGDDVDVPELFTGKPYDPYKLDVYTLGNVFLKEFYQKFGNLGFLADLIEFMRNPSFEARPTAQKVLKKWYHIRETLDEDVLEDEVLVYRPGKRPKPIPTLQPDNVPRPSPVPLANSSPSASVSAAPNASASASGSGSRSRASKNSSARSRQAQPAPPTSPPVAEVVPVREIGLPEPVSVIYYFTPPQQDASSSSSSSKSARPTNGSKSATPPIGPVPRMGSGPARGSGPSSLASSSASTSTIGPPMASLIPIRDVGPPQPLPIPISYLPPPPPIPLYHRQIHNLHPYPQPFPQPYPPHSYLLPAKGRGPGVALGTGRGASGAGTGAGNGAGSGAVPSAGSGAGKSTGSGAAGERQGDRDTPMDVDAEEEKKGSPREMSTEPFKESESQGRNYRPKNIRLAPGSWQ